MKRLHTHSQNFLRSPTLVKKLMGHSNIKKTDIVYDIGAGSGVITSALARVCTRVVAIEYEPRTFQTLSKNVGALDNVTVVQADFLAMNLPDEQYKIFANIPFHLSSPILRKIMDTPHPPVAVYLILQKQFARKLLIGTDQFTGLLGAMITPQFTVRIRYNLQRSDFWPSPAVDTVFVELLQRDVYLLPSAELPQYRAFVERCFSRQKYFDTFGLNKRPSELNTEEWMDLYTTHNRT